MRANEGFWLLLERLVNGSEIKVDRPRGSAHPRYPDFVYPLDYGYLEGTRSGDGGGVDVWVGSLPEKRVTGAVVTVDGEKRDIEVKVLVGCTPEEARMIAALHNEGEQAGLLLERLVE